MIFLSTRLASPAVLFSALKIAATSSRKAVSFSSARTTKRFRRPDVRQQIRIVRLLELKAPNVTTVKNLCLIAGLLPRTRGIVSGVPSRE